MSRRGLGCRVGVVGVAGPELPVSLSDPVLILFDYVCVYMNLLFGFY